MKKLMMVFILIYSGLSYGFEPISGMKLFCVSKFSKLQYELRIEDLGDESAEIKVIKNEQVVELYSNAGFNEYDRGSYFSIHNVGGIDGDFIAFDFADNNLEQAVLENNHGDIEKLDCSIAEF